jgi:hypothetical protein
MKNITTLIIILIISHGFCFAQNEVKVLEKASTTLYIIKLNNGEKLSTQDLMVAPSEIQSLDILTKDQIKNNYPNNRFDMVAIVMLKSNVKLLNIIQILDKYKIDPKYRNYTILDEDLKVENPDKMLASENILQDVVVNTDKQYINIITKLYQNTLKARKEANEDRLKRIEQFKNSNY